MAATLNKKQRHEKWTTQFTDAQIAEAMEASGGRVGQAASLLGSDWATVDAHIKRSLSLRCAYPPDIRAMSDAQILNALIQTGGVRSAAARLLGVYHTTVYDRIESSPALRSAWLELETPLLDLAETRLYEAVDRCEPWAVALMLKTKGKHRGWVERTEVTGKNGASVQPITQVNAIIEGNLTVVQAAEQYQRMIANDG